MPVLAKRGIIRPSPFAYPGTSPRLDTSHFAARGIQFSGIPFGAGFISLATGGLLTKAGSPTSKVLSSIGPTAVFAGGGTTDAWRFTGNSTNFTSSTVAAMILFDSISTNQFIFANANNSTGLALNVAGTGNLQWTMFGVVARSSGILLSAGVPYFVIASQNTGAIDFLAMRLDNGVIATASTASGTPAAPNGTYQIGNGPATTTPIIGQIAAVMFSSEYMSPQMQRQWASDPWSFWYPR